MLKKISVCIIILAFLLCVLFCVKRDKNLIVTRVVSPVEFVLETKDFKFADLETFDRTYSEKNKNLAKNLGITETEAFILGNLAYNWAYNLMKGQKVFVKNGEARLEDGTLAGSVLRMTRAVQNMVEKVGVPFIQAVDYATINPARMLKIDDVTGSIKVGKNADFTVINHDFDVLLTIRDGEIIYQA